MSGPGLARTYSMSVVGIEGHLVDVETYAGAGLVAFTLVGLLDTSVREARDRVRAAFESCGLDVLDQRITVNLSPAGIPKSGSVFDLAIASSIALATGLVLPRAFEDSVIVGELALDGSIQPVRGVLPAVLSARSLGVRRVIVPSACAREAQLVSGIEVIAFEHLADMIAWGGGEAIKAPFHGHLGVRRRGLFCGGCLDPRHGGCSRPARSRCGHWKSPLREDTTCFCWASQALAKQCSPRAFPQFCPTWTRTPPWSPRPFTLSPASSRRARLSSRVLRSRHPTTR